MTLSLLTLVPVLLPALASSPAPRGEKDIVDTAVAAGAFTTLVKAVTAAELVETLKGAGPFTVFAPNDEAFARVPAADLQKLLKDPKALRSVLTYHVVKGRVLAADVAKARLLETVQGGALRVTVDEGEVRVDGARVIRTDILATNGVIHVLDAVVMPRKDIVDTAAGAGTFSTLVAAVKAAGLVDTLRGAGPFTVFAPDDEAFAKLPAGALDGLLSNPEKLRGVLTFHVVPGRILSEDLPKGAERPSRTEVRTVQGGMLAVERTRDGAVTVNGIRVKAADVLAGNGVIHVLEGVVLPR